MTNIYDYEGNLSQPADVADVEEVTKIAEMVGLGSHEMRQLTKTMILRRQYGKSKENTEALYAELLKSLDRSNKILSSFGLNIRIV